MKSKFCLSLTGILFFAGNCFAQQSSGMKPMGSMGSMGQETSKSTEAPVIASDPAQPFIDMGKQMIADEKFSESKEALKTAIRIAPMSLQLWALYDDAVIGEYIARKRQEKLNAVIERDINPTFSINSVDSYIELDTLYLVGSIQNLSKETRQKIHLTARMLDENKRELRSETGTLRNSERGLFPNESSLFEIPFKNPPAGSKSFRVEVSAYE